LYLGGGEADWQNRKELLSRKEDDYSWGDGGRGVLRKIEKVDERGSSIIVRKNACPFLDATRKGRATKRGMTKRW